MAMVAVGDIGHSAASWRRVAFAMFAVGWGANQFSPLLIVYRHDLRLDAGVLAGLFGVYAATLIPGLLIGGPVSDRIGRRKVVIPFVALSPVATLLFMIGPRSLAVIAAVTTSSRAIALACAALFGCAYGLCLVSGLRESERLAGRREHAAVVACYYVLTYVGFGAAYLADGLNAVIGRAATFVALAVAAALTAIWTGAYTAVSRRAHRPGGVRRDGRSTHEPGTSRPGALTVFSIMEAARGFLPSRGPCLHVSSHRGSGPPLGSGTWGSRCPRIEHVLEDCLPGLAADAAPSAARWPAPIRA